MAKGDLIHKLSERIVWIINSPKHLVIFTITELVIVSLLYCAIEGVGLRDGWWWSIVTFTTVGYGDLSPATLPARVLAGVHMLIAVFLIVPAVTASMASRLIVDRDAFTHEEQEELKDLLRVVHDDAANHSFTDEEQQWIKDALHELLEDKRSQGPQDI